MRILIADDDPDQLACLASMLQSAGHEVVTARHGLAAMQQYAKARRGEGFDYVVTDYQMPEKNGVVLIMEIRAIDPAQKVILVSGDPPKLNAMTKELTGEFPMLAKPYRSADLLKLLV